MSGPGLPGLELAAQIVESARAPRGEPFAVVFVGIGITAREADAFSSLAKPVRLAEVTQMVTQAMRLTYDWPPAR